MLEYRRTLLEIHKLKMKYIEATEEVIRSNSVESKEDTEDIDEYLLTKQSEFINGYNKEVKEYNRMYNNVAKNKGGNDLIL